MAPKKDPLKAKEAKQKKIAILGGVLLLGLLAFQVPRTMKMLHPAGNVTTSASSKPAATTAGSTPLAPPSLDGSSASTASAGTSGSSGSGSATSADGVVDASSGMPASSGQLISFNRFKSKDPFVQQVTDCTTGDCSSSTTAPAGASGAASGSGSGSVAGTNGPSTPAGGSGSGGSALKTVTTASISVNGAASKVTVGRTFPSSDPVFVLVSLKAKSAKISIAGGSIEGGAPSVTLSLGKTVKLQNTADGSLYALTLVGTSA
jgi:hypothetical protein